MSPNPTPPDNRLQALIFLTNATRELLGEAAGPPAPWEARLKLLNASENERLRVAVAGTVKSGKSTLVNALVGRDALKRGAGIITSLVTRVRPGESLRARVHLKGWAQVNREATEAALFLGGADDGREADLRRAEDRARLEAALEALGDEAYSESGSFDRNVALLRAYLEGYGAVHELIREEEHTVEFAGDEFVRHQQFSGSDATAAYVEELVLEMPGLPFPGSYEIGDCQGYDSPNPRHMEKVQEYLMGAHAVVYVVSSRVGVREADLRLVHDIKALGLLDATTFVLNTDLGEHKSAEELPVLRAEMESVLRGLAGEVSIYTFSALRALLLARRRAGESLSKQEELFLALWEETAAGATDEFDAFVAFLDEELGGGRRRRITSAREAVARQAADALRARVATARALAGAEADQLDAQVQALKEARDRVANSLESLERTLKGTAETLRVELFRKLEDAFHPSRGAIAREVLEELGTLRAPAGSLEAADRKNLLRQMAKIYQEMKAAAQRFRVESVNPRAVERIRSIWKEVSADLASTAAAQADLLVHSVEAYRSKAAALGIQVPPLELPPLDPSIGRRTIPLYSATTYGSGPGTTEQVLSFAAKWTRKAAVGWAKRLLQAKERHGFAHAMLADGAEAVRAIIVEEARWDLLEYTEKLKYRVLGKSLEELVSAWSAAYRETVDALVVDLERLADRLQEKESQREDLIPRLEDLLRTLDRAAA
ncbi:MAG: hypothetical protein Kow0092_07100 [Deferrisomatales bacterium]